MTRNTRHGSQRGLLLLPVALVLAITGALAYSMTREGSMNVSAVDAEYDIEVARYLAEAGLNLAKWQNEKRGCDDEGFGTVDLPGGSIVANDDDVHDHNQGAIAVSLVATTTRGAVHRLEGRTVVLHKRDVDETTFGSSGGQDTHIVLGGTAQVSSSDYLEVSDAQSHALVKFNLSGLRNVTVLTAELKLTQTDTKSSQPVRSLAVHRVTTDWALGSATWAAPWSTPGGDYAPQAAAAVAIDGNAQYTWRIDALVEGWANDSLPNYGVLLKPSGLLEARFASFDNSGNGNRPQLVVRYRARC